MQRRAIILLIGLFALGVATFGLGAALRANANAKHTVNAPQKQNPYEVTATCDKGDGRVNTLCHDEAQTAALYCNADGSITVRGYVTPPGIWPVVFTVSRATILSVGVPAHNTVLGSGGGVRLYRLSTGRFQVNAPGQHGGQYVWPRPTTLWLGCGGY